MISSSFPSRHSWIVFAWVDSGTVDYLMIVCGCIDGVNDLLTDGSTWCGNARQVGAGVHTVAIVAEGEEEGLVKLMIVGDRTGEGVRAG